MKLLSQKVIRSAASRLPWTDSFPSFYNILLKPRLGEGSSVSTTGSVKDWKWVEIYLSLCAYYAVVVALEASSGFWTSWTVFRIVSQTLTCRLGDISVTCKLCKPSCSSCWSHILRCSCTPKSKTSCCTSARRTTETKESTILIKQACWGHLYNDLREYDIYAKNGN